MTTPTETTVAEKAIRFTYKNWRGEVRERKAVPEQLWFGASPWHPEPQWLLQAWDLEKEERRYFALRNVSGWRPA